MSKTKLHELTELGQSIWLDYINRRMLENGQLQQWLDQGLRGMTSNPSIFNQVISQSSDYDEKIVQLKEKGASTFEVYDELTVKDIQDAADIFKNLYQSSNRLDGYVSLEINPKLAHDAKASIVEGKRLFKKVNRPNVMIKVPATPAGFPVIEELLASKINVNVTLIFSVEQYTRTVEAFFHGLTRLAQQEADLSGIQSVASVFVSRIDTSVDKILETRLSQEKDATQKQLIQSLLGKAAVANSRIIFEKFEELFAGETFKALAQKKASVQRVLWGSTGTKNPAYSDVKYIEELIAQPTVNTVPEKTIQAFLDHGKVKDALGYDAKISRDVVSSLKKDFSIDVDAVCIQLLSEGVRAFEIAFDELLQSIETKAKKLCGKS